MTDEGKRTRTDVTLLVDGQEVPLNHFTESALVGVVEGFLSALREVGPGEVTLVIPEERRLPVRRS